MSKVQVAIIDVLSTGEWMNSSDIAKEVGYKSSSVRVGLSGLCHSGLIVKKDDPASKLGASLYKLSSQRCGFGVSYNISQFDQLLREVRT